MFLVSYTTQATHSGFEAQDFGRLTRPPIDVFDVVFLVRSQWVDESKTLKGGMRSEIVTEICQ